MVDTDESAARTTTYRREPLAYCSRLLGSVDDAEDLVWETLPRARPGYDDVEGRSLPRDLSERFDLPKTRP